MGVYNIHRNVKLETNHRLCDLYFDGDIGANLKQLDEKFEDLNFNDMDDFDAPKIALYYFAYRVLNGRKDEHMPNSSLLNHVDDLKYFKSLPWGCSSWKTVYDSLDTTLNKKLEAFQDSTLKEVKYNLYGFCPSVALKSQIWLLCLVLNND